ncbi:MAG: nitroreductase/quinone reductase family protein [Dehalococcoidia bacterium]
MNDDVRKALLAGGVCDITTTGRKSGEARRIEIRLHHIDGKLYLSGQPGRRSWYANLLADPAFTIHLKRDVMADVPARAVPVQDPTERRQVFVKMLDNVGRPEQLEDRMTKSPLVQLVVDLGQG